MGLFRGTARYYKRFRPGYPAELIRLLAERTALAGTGRVLDLGTGTGQIAVPIAAYAGEVVAVDPEPEMLAELDAPPNVRTVLGRAEDVVGALGFFELVTIGSALHWLEPDLLDRLQTNQVALLGEFMEESDALTSVREVAEDVLGPRPAMEQPTVRYVDALAASPFSDVVELAVPYERTWTVDQLVGYAYSTSFASLQRYDLYRIPFNGGKGGTPERIVGASENGMSNNFPKVSPDGKWIVFVQCKNGLLMRPDSKLYIVPFEGGEARPLESNLPVMNSWHTWSPNGHWLAFSSKSPSFYTRLYLTHIDEQGHASPPLEVENATASNRAVNIPEFVNVGAGDLDHIETPAIDFYREFDTAQQLQDEAKYADAVPAWKIAAAKDPTDARPYNNLGVALAAMGQFQDAIDAYGNSLSINPDSSQTHNNLGSALAEAGKLDAAIEQIHKAIELNPDNGAAHVNMGHILVVSGGDREQTKLELQKGIELAPKLADGHNLYGVILAREGRLDDAIAEMQIAVDLAPRSAECHFNLGRAFAANSRFTDAVPHFEAAASLTGGKEPAILQMLAGIYSDTGKYAKAVEVAQHALDLAEQRQDQELAAQLRANLARYRQQAQSTQP